MNNRLKRWGLVFLFTATMGMLYACGGKKVVERPTAPPGEVFRGPAYLNGTVGSMTTRRGFAPTYVSGYGLVVNLPGTGSPEVPGFLRQEMVQRLRREGFGSRIKGLADMTPDSILSSNETAVVAVEAMIPAGAVAGTPFDVLVSAMPQTGTTNLEGGFLRNTDLSLFGTNEQMKYSHPLAKARGSMYLNPFDAKSTTGTITEQNLQAVIIGGGVVTKSSHLELILNQPSWPRSSQIATRINEVFRQEAPDRNPTAVAKTDLSIYINVPSRYANDVGGFLDLMEHVYTQRGPTFEKTQAQVLGELVTLNPQEARHVSLAWEGLGKRALDVIRTYYKHDNLTVRLAALTAGVKLDDQLAADPLLGLSTHSDVQVRLQVAQILEHLHNSMRGSRTLLSMIDDDDTRVRIAAYESLMMNDHPAIKHQYFYWDKQPKFTLDMVPSEKPLVYISTRNGPRVVIFDLMTPLAPSLFTSMWDTQLMIRREKDSDLATVFYQERDSVEGITQPIAAAAANLVLLMGHESTIESPAPGFNLPFSRVVNVLYTMCKSGQILAPFEFQQTPLAVQIAQARSQQQDPTIARPWSDPAAVTTNTEEPKVPTQNINQDTNFMPDATSGSTHTQPPIGRPLTGPR